MFSEIVKTIQDYQGILALVGIGSALLFVFSLLMLPWLLKLIPSDYFSRPNNDNSWRIFLYPQTLLRNLIGVPILLAGILMLVLPGQGLLTILLGLAIMQFPGKSTLERWLIKRKGVLTAVNWLRRKAGGDNLQL